MTDAGKQIDEMFDPSYKISKMQYIILKINKMSLLLRKNRFTEALRIIKDVEEICHPKFLMFNYDFIVNKYYTFKKTKEELAIKKLIN